MFTNGVARYLRRVNLGDYQHAEASAEVSWSAVDRPAEALALSAQAAEHARLLVEQQLGIGKPATVSPPGANAQPMTVKGLQAAGLSVTEIEHVDVGTQTIADPAGMTDKAALAATMTNGGTGEITSGLPTAAAIREAFGTGRKQKSATQVVEADPADMGPPAAAHTVSSASAAPTSSPSTVGQNLMSSEPTPVEVWTALPEAKTYTVADLGRACSDAVVRLKAAGDQAPTVTVQTLVGKFGKATNAIPEDKRAEFLAELALLEPRK